MVVLENHIRRDVENQYPVRMVICAAAATVFPAEPCMSPLRNRECQGRSRLKIPPMEQGGATFRMWGVVRTLTRKIGFVVTRDKDGMRAETMGTCAPQKNEDCKPLFPRCCAASRRRASFHVC